MRELLGFWSVCLVVGCGVTAVWLWGWWAAVLMTGVMTGSLGMFLFPLSERTWARWDITNALKTDEELEIQYPEKP